MYKLCPTCKVQLRKAGKLEWLLSGMMVVGCLVFFVVGFFLVPFLPLLLLLPTRYNCKICGAWYKESEVLTVDKLG